MGLRKAPNVYATKAGFWIFAEWRIYTTKRQYYRYRRSQFERLASI